MSAPQDKTIWSCLDCFPSLCRCDDCPKPDMARCGGCGWKGSIGDCDSGVEQENWEMPAYGVHYCPACGEAIEDYFFAEGEGGES